MRNIIGLLAIAGLVTGGSLFAKPISIGPKASFGLGSNIGDLGTSAGSAEAKPLSGFNYGFGVEGIIELPVSTFLATVGLEYSRRTAKFDIENSIADAQIKVTTPQIELPIYLGGLFADKFIMMGGLIPRFGMGDVKTEIKVEGQATQKDEADYDDSDIKKFGLGAGFRFGALMPMATGKLMPTLNFEFDVLDRNDNDFGDDSIRNFSVDASVTYLF